MDQETAQAIVFGLVAIGAVVWLFGLRTVTRAFRVQQTVQEPDTLTEVPASPNRLTGSTEVDGQPAALAARAAALLARGTQLGPVKIVEKTDDHVTFERVGPAPLPSRNETQQQVAARWFLHGDLRFAAARQGRCRVEWTADVAGRGSMLKLAVMFLMLGLLALCIGGWALSTYVVPSPIPAIRGQSVQMIQAAHFLWPPFLFAARYRRGMAAVAAEFEALANNLPYAGE